MCVCVCVYIALVALVWVPSEFFEWCRFVQEVSLAVVSDGYIC